MSHHEHGLSRSLGKDSSPHSRSICKVDALVHNLGRHRQHRPCTLGGSSGTVGAGPRRRGIAGRRRIDSPANVALQRGPRRIRTLARMIQSGWTVGQRRNE